MNYGDIFYAKLGLNIGSEQNGLRPVVIVQNNIGNKFSPTVVIIPVSTKVEKKKLPTHVLLNTTCGLPKESVALVEQIRTIDKVRLIKKITTISLDDLEKIKKAVKENLNIRYENIF